MPYISCADCKCEHPMGETFVLAGTRLCWQCDQQRRQAAGGRIEGLQRAIDPTVCARCGTDCGDRELPELMGLPVCDSCSEKARNVRFPAWVKLATAVVLVLAALSMARNWRFFQGYVEARRGQREAKARRYRQARKLLVSAGAHVPESADLAIGARIYAAYAAADDGDFEPAHTLLADLAKEHPEDGELANQVREMSAMRYAKQAQQKFEDRDFA